MKAPRLWLAALLLGTAGVSIVAAADSHGEVRPAASDWVRLRLEGSLPAFDGAIEWLNSAPLSASSLRGKVVVVEFWTYTCINWRRTLPYVRAWSAKYKDQGLVVIGVHTPEFEFEKQLDNVREATREMSIDYPIAIDSNYAIWRAFGNEYWPALYFIDVQGRIRHHHFGEGDYAQSERVIQELLAEAGAGGASSDLVSVDGVGFEASADWPSLKSPETYVGYERTQNFASPGGPRLSERRVYTAPARLRLNHWALEGEWTMQKGAIALNAAPGRIVYQFHARDLHLIMGPRVRGSAVRFRVSIDGRPAGMAHGIDIDEQGNGTVSEQRMYQLIRQQEPIADRRFEIEFLDGDVEAFDFSFG